jgi:outer membrane cobalamin receptor
LFVAGAHLLRRPMHTLDAGVGYRGARGAVDLRARHVGSREDNYFAPDFSANHVTLPAYTRVDLSGDATLVPGDAGRGMVVATVRAENLFDAQYTETAGFNFDGRQGDMSNTGYRAAPRRVLAGLRLSF